MDKRRVAFVCTGNSCRSQMAEGWARALAGDRWEIYSAGLEAHGVNPRAVQVMAEVGVDISGQTAKTLDIRRYLEQQVIVTLCGDANERCPIAPRTALLRRHWDLPDPAKATGSEAEILDQFRAVRDDIRRRVEALLTELAG